jgi:DNA-directed RNA polymerase specialized sigma24 family protein
MAAHSTTRTEPWEEILKGSDKEAFQKVVMPHMDVLIDAARRDLTYYVRNGALHEGDFSPEELVGEGLIHSWKHRKVRPADMPLRSWLLSTQHRVTRGLVGRFRTYRREKELSLDEPVSINADSGDTQEWFWDWYQPEQELTWEDVIPAGESVDEAMELDASSARLLEESDRRHALMLHDEFQMALPHISFAINRSPDDVARLLQQARAGLGDRRRYDQGQDAQGRDAERRQGAPSNEPDRSDA